jgi:5-methylcytosine-specific restriction endonuclease McrA
MSAKHLEATMKLSDHPEYVRFKPLTKMQFGKLLIEQDGKCATCKEPLVFKARQIREEHLHQRSMGGKHDLDNISLTCIKCAIKKDKADSLARKKLRSLLKTTKKSQKPKQKIQGKTKIQSRGFGNTYKPNIKEID